MSLEIGQRVVFRSLHWEVANTSSDTFVELFGKSAENQGRRVRVLLNLEEVQRAEVPELRWTLGERGWDVRQWKALHDAFRFTLSHGRGNLASVDWGRLILEPYQLEPLRRIEQLPFPRLLLADDTGLGKTAEAGLILFRLLQKRRADRILVLCKARPEPERWQHELLEKFGIEAVVINDSSDVVRLRREVPAHLNVFGYYPRMIMSMHFAAQTHILDELRREIRWDIAIFDEAHHMAEREDGPKRLADLGRVVAERTEALLLLTATPHDGKPATYASLIRLLDPYTIVDPEHLDPRLIEPLVVRRLKQEVEKADGSRFLQRELHILDVDRYRGRAERGLDKGIREYAKRLAKLSEQLAQQGKREQAFGAAFLGTFFKKRLASSVYACRSSLRARLNTIHGKQQIRMEQPTIAQAALLERSDEGEEVSDLDSSTEFLDGMVFADGQTEEAVLLDLLARAEKVTEGQESKIQALLQLLHRCLDGTQEKVVIFTEFRDTLDLAERVLTEHGYGAMLVTYHGETSPAEREDRRYAFLTDPRVRIFLATDAASEGINLHKSCNILIHIEIPWNPNRYEQRNGRIDRYGQQSRPTIYLLVSPRSVEQRVSQVVIEKLERIGRELGSVSNVFPIAQRISIEEFLSLVDTERIEQIEQTLPDDATSNPELEKVAEEMEQLVDGIREHDVQQFAQRLPAQVLTGERFGTQERAVIEQQLASSRAFVPEYQDVEEFLRVFLTLQGMSDGRLLPTGQPGIYAVDVPRRLQEELRDAHGQCIERYPRATFQRLLAIQEAEREVGQRAEFLSPGHPLIQMALRYMRGSAFNPQFPSRIAYRRTPAGSTPGFIFTYAVRFVDGRGEMIEERFEAVFVALDGTASQHSEDDMHLFTAQKAFGNLSAQEERQLLPRFQAAFESAKATAMAEMQRRRAMRCEELSQQQIDISERALMRLGVWEKASEERIKARFPDLPFAGNIVQLSLAPTAEQRRRATLFEREIQRLTSQEGERRRDIRAMRSVRGEAIDTIGALVMIPE